jgi:hypothetical protein
MSWNRGGNKELDLSPGESSAISTSKLSTSISSKPTNALSRLPQEIRDHIQDYATTIALQLSYLLSGQIETCMQELFATT